MNCFDCIAFWARSRERWAQCQELRATGACLVQHQAARDTLVTPQISHREEVITDQRANGSTDDFLELPDAAATCGLAAAAAGHHRGRRR